jgi:hypothetical protein|tara:strand:- start:365 stop:529 length:165 start_codon:yes stop_codon:yes gene_type:complete
LNGKKLIAEYKIKQDSMAKMANNGFSKEALRFGMSVPKISIENKRIKFVSNSKG